MKNKLLAGILISIGGIVFLQFEGLPGALLSSIGLLAILYSNSELWIEDMYNEEVGWDMVLQTGKTLGINLLAVWLMSFLFSEMRESSSILVQSHLDYGYWFPRAILCGFVLDITLWYSRSAGPLFIFLGTTVFMILGYPHILTEFFYISIGGMWTTRIIWYCIVVLSGNIIGANIRKILSPRKPYR